MVDVLRHPHQVVPMVERQHALVEALRVRAPRPVTAAVLARDLGVRRRTVERDVARLRDAGLPIQVRRGPGGGYALRCPERVAAVNLTPGEIAALVAALATVGPSTSASALSAMRKLVDALTPGES